MIQKNIIFVSVALAVSPMPAFAQTPVKDTDGRYGGKYDAYYFMGSNSICGLAKPMGNSIIGYASKKDAPSVLGVSILEPAMKNWPETESPYSITLDGKPWEARVMFDKEGGRAGAKLIALLERTPDMPFGLTDKPVDLAFWQDGKIVARAVIDPNADAVAAWQKCMAA